MIQPGAGERKRALVSAYPFTNGALEWWRHRDHGQGFDWVLVGVLAGRSRLLRWRCTVCATEVVM